MSEPSGTVLEAGREMTDAAPPDRRLTRRHFLAAAAGAGAVAVAGGAAGALLGTSVVEAVAGRKDVHDLTSGNAGSQRAHAPNGTARTP